MNPEQGPNQTDNNNLDPSIDPKVLIEQDGVDAGRISAAETSVGDTTIDVPEFSPVGPEERPGEIVEGLPVIGAEAENANRNEGYIPSDNDMGEFKKRSKNSPESILYGKVPEGTTPEQMADILHDETGTEAMATEVRSRAEGIAKARAVAETGKPPSDEKVKEYADLIEASFISELEKKSQESIKAANAIVDTMIAEAKAKLAEGKPVSEVVPNVTEALSKDPGYIDTTIEAPAPGHL